MRIRRLEETGALVYRSRPQIPIVGFTVNQLKGDTYKCLQAGMDDYMAKPASTKQHLHILVKWATLVRPLNDIESEPSSASSSSWSKESSGLAQVNEPPPPLVKRVESPIALRTLYRNPVESN